MIPTAPAKVEFPAPEMTKHRFNHFHAELVDRIAMLTCKQHMAGQLVVPEAVVLVQRHVTNNYRAGSGDEVDFRFTFQVATGVKSDPYESWLVVVPCDDPQHGLVNETTTIRPSKLYVWDQEKGWQQSIEFQHPWVEKEVAKFSYADKSNPLDWPAA